MMNYKTILNVILVLLICAPPAFTADQKSVSVSYTFPIVGSPDGKLLLPYDPSKCSQDPKGMVYFAVGTQVFRQPVNSLVNIVSGSGDWKQALPKPPSPLEPEGCPGHPIQEATYDLQPFSQISDKPRELSSSYADRISIALRGTETTTSEDALFDSMCKKYGINDMAEPGLVGCRKSFKCDPDIAYQTRDYLTPTGKKMSLWCRNNAPNYSCVSGPFKCEGGYSLSNNINLHFIFDSDKMPISEFIGADRMLRYRLETAEVKNYPWPDAQTNNPTELKP